MTNFPLAYILLIGCWIQHGLVRAITDTFAYSFVSPINYLGVFRAIVNAKIRSLSLLLTCVEDKIEERIRTFSETLLHPLFFLFGLAVFLDTHNFIRRHSNLSQFARLWADRIGNQNGWVFPSKFLPFLPHKSTRGKHYPSIFHPIPLLSAQTPPPPPPKEDANDTHLMYKNEIICHNKHKSNISHITDKKIPKDTSLSHLLENLS